MKATQPKAPNRAQHPDTSVNRALRRAIRFKRVLDIVPLCASRIYELIAAGDFPKPFKLITGGHASVFWEHEIYDWLDQRAAASKGGAK